MSDTCEQPLPATERYGKYVLMQRLGVGGMAEAFKAVVEGARGFRRVVVVKRILPHLAAHEQLVEQFTHEARLCALLSHPNIVQIEDFGEADGTHFIAMEYLDGRPLLWLLQRLGRANERMPLTVAASIAHQIATGLEYAHQLRGPSGEPLAIIHRDVKPANVMLLFNGTVKLLDFGVAKAANMAGQPPTCDGILKGTVGYHAPEQLMGEPLDGRTDIFSLGVVLWEMLAVQRLFWSSTTAMTYRKVLDEPVPAPSSVRPEVPLALEQIVMRALQRSPGDRYSSAAEMAADLQAWLHEQVVDPQEMALMLRKLQSERYQRGAADGPDSGILAVERAAAPSSTGRALPAPVPISGAADVASSNALAGIGQTQRVRRGRRPLVLAAAACAGAGLLTFLMLRPPQRAGKQPEQPPPVERAAGAAVAPAPPAAKVEPVAPVESGSPTILTAPAAKSRRKHRRGSSGRPSGKAMVPSAAGMTSSAESKILNAEPEDPFK